MSEGPGHAELLEAQKRNQRLLYFVFGAIILVVIGLRLRLTSTFDADAFAPVYNDICAELRSGEAFSDEVYGTVRRRVRATGTSGDVLFLFQYVSTVSERTPMPPPMEIVEAPIRARVAAGDFDGALEMVRDAMLTTDAMPAERAEVWGRFIREMQRRWDNDCLPVERAVDALPAG